MLNLSDSFLCPEVSVKTEKPAIKNEKIDNLLPVKAELALIVDWGGGY